MDVLTAIATRRTHKIYSGEPTTDEVLRELLQAAITAPNHRFTEPWRFSVARKPRLDALADVVCAALDTMRKPDAGSDVKLTTKQNKLRRRLSEAAAVIAACQVTSPDDEQLDREDYAATCCAVQNLMLAATGHGLVALWSTSKALQHPMVREFLQIPAGERVVGVLFLGHPTTELPCRRSKTVDDVTRWV